MGVLGRGVVSIRTVTIRKKGADEDDGSSVGEDVLSERPSFTVGFGELCAYVSVGSFSNCYF